MNSDGANVWAKLTKENIGRQIAVVLDDYVYSFPVVRSEIKGGSSEISGNFSIAEAKDLANILKAGKLPAPARIIEEAVVGPSLGREAIQASLISFVLAFILVMIYMVLYYNRAGIVASIALVANLFFLFGVLASLGAALTLPGLAGIVMTMGMAVDANVLIFERIREELRHGKGLSLSIADGFKHAYSAIIDSNVTTILTAIVLFIFGHGPIRGFATTLIIGICTSLFAAIFLSRLMFLWLLSKNKTINFSNKYTENTLVKANFPFITKRKIGYIISGTFVLITILSLSFRGLNQGVDFKGGRTFVVRFEEKLTSEQIAKALRTSFGTQPEVKQFGTDGYKITTKFMIDSNAANADSIVEAKMYEGLKPILTAGVTYEKFIADYRQSSQKVGPTIADDIKIGSVWAILGALAIMFGYIFIRFKNWQYGLGAIAALAHDAIFVIGLFSLFYSIMPFSLEIDQAFIAAILTVIGYSVNDTVIIYDRIREYLSIHKKKDRGTIMNDALNSTLTRTLNTAGTTLVTLLAIFIFGGDVIRGFVFALFTGIAIGTYSSIFISAPVVYDTIKQVEKAEEVKSRRRKAAIAAAEADTKTE